MMQDFEGQIVSVVLIGKFNPAIFSPGWLARVGVIGDEAMDAAIVEVIHREVAKFHANDLRYEITTNRFQVQMVGDPAIKVCDTAAAIFGRLLPHTPIVQLGINFNFHFATSSLRQRTSFGRALAPTAPWGAFGKRVSATEGLDTGGMLSLTMREQGLNDREKGWRQVTVEPSAKTKAELGVSVSVNDHFDCTSSEKVEASASKVIGILQERFEPSIAEARKIVQDLMTVAKGFPA